MRLGQRVLLFHTFILCKCFLIFKRCFTGLDKGFLMVTFLYSYEERCKALETITQNLQEPTTFEDFCVQLCCPGILIPTGGSSGSLSGSPSQFNFARIYLDVHISDERFVFKCRVTGCSSEPVIWTSFKFGSRHLLI